MPDSTLVPPVSSAVIGLALQRRDRSRDGEHHGLIFNF